MYVKNRHIGESGRLISDVIEIAKIKNVSHNGYWRSIWLLDHNFLIIFSEKYGFSKHCIWWIKILLRDKESCVLNGCITVKYFSLWRDAHQSDALSLFSINLVFI